MSAEPREVTDELLEEIRAEIDAERESFRRAAFEAGRQRGRDEALPIAFADCEALVAAGLLALAEKEDEEARQSYEAFATCPGLADAANAARAMDRHKARGACLREMSLAVGSGQFRTAECDERAIVAAHREAAGFNPSKAGGEARSRALSPAKRKQIAKLAARARWAAKKGE